MATAISRPPALPSAWPFVSAFTLLVLSAAWLAGSAPIQVSIWAVFLFAGPHNWMEGRYFLARLPARFDNLRLYFGVGFGGVLLLAAAFWTLPWQGPIPALWHSGLAVWTASLIILRRRESPRGDCLAVLPPVCLWLAAAWFAPAVLDVAIIYAHPLLAFWFLDRQIRRSRPEWAPAWRRSLGAIPILLVLLMWRLASSPPPHQ
jgi:hypothetical protein